MTYLEHYFENLLFDGKDKYGSPNLRELSDEQQKAVEVCAEYVLYILFNGRKDLKDYISRN